MPAQCIISVFNVGPHTRERLTTHIYNLSKEGSKEQIKGTCEENTTPNDEQGERSFESRGWRGWTLEKKNGEMTRLFLRSTIPDAPDLRRSASRISSFTTFTRLHAPQPECSDLSRIIRF